MGSAGRGGPPLPTREDGTPERENVFGGGGWQSHGSYMRDKEDKLRAQQAAQANVVSSALRGVTLHIDGLSGGRVTDLSDLVAAHGGEFVQYPHWSQVTHLVANTLPAAKIKWASGHLAERRRAGHPFYIVSEEWLVQSAAQARRLPEADFALPMLTDPEQGSLRGFVATRVPRLAPGPAAPEPLPAPAPPPPVDVAALAPAPAAASSARHEGVGGIVLHVDVDAFFAQCHQVHAPATFPRDKPLAVQQHQDIIGACARDL